MSNVFETILASSKGETNIVDILRK